MGLRHVLRTRFRELFQHEASARDIDEELRYHLEREIEQRIIDGMNPLDARRTALRDFGGVERYRDELRGQRTGSWVDDMAADVRIALRGFRKRPSFPLVVCITLGIAIAATTSIFSVVDGALLKPLPFRESEKLVTLWQTNVTDNLEYEEPSPGNFMDWRDRARSYTDIVAARPWGLDYETSVGMETIDSWQVSESFFEVLDGPEPLLGRVLQKEDYIPGRNNVVVLAHRSWMQFFGGDSGIIGRTVRLDGGPMTVVGVMPRHFEFPAGRYAWHPEPFTEVHRRNRFATMLAVIGRLKPGVTIEQASSELKSIAADLAVEHPRVNGQRGANIRALNDALLGDSRPLLYTLLGAVLIVLGIACANVATLMLARANQRVHEMALRVTIGARRSRLLRQTLTEALVLAAGACAVGIALSVVGVRVLRALSPATLPRIDQIALDERTILFALALAIATVFLFGLAPALRESGVSPAARLRDSGIGTIHGRSRPFARRALTISEVALSMVLVVGAGLLIRSMNNVLGVERGYSTDRVLTFSMQIWQEYPTPGARLEFVRRTLERLKAVPGIAEVSTASALPLSEVITNEYAGYSRADAPVITDSDDPAVPGVEVNPGYFAAMGTALLRGRDFLVADDSASPPVVIVSERFARSVWPGEDAIGKRLRVSYSSAPVEREVVGIVQDVRRFSLDQDPQPTIYIPYAQSRSGALNIVIRSAVADPFMLTAEVRSAFRELNRRLPLNAISSVQGLLDSSLRARRFSLLLLTGFAALAVVLAAVGLYGILAQSAQERSKELAIRSALGASPWQATRVILREFRFVLAAGALIGIALSASTAGVLRSLLFNVAPLDPTSFAGAVMLLVAIGALASAVPLLRAYRVEPSRTLRTD